MATKLINRSDPVESGGVYVSPGWSPRGGRGVAPRRRGGGSSVGDSGTAATVCAGAAVREPDADKLRFQCPCFWCVLRDSVSSSIPLFSRSSCQRLLGWRLADEDRNRGPNREVRLGSWFRAALGSRDSCRFPTFIAAHAMAHGTLGPCGSCSTSRETRIGAPSPPWR